MRYCDSPSTPPLTQGQAAPALGLSEDRARALVALWASLGGCLVSRLFGFIGTLRARGDRAVYARPAHYIAAAAGSSTAATYSLTLARSEGPLLVASIEHPSAGTASILASALRVGGQNRIDSDALCDAWCDPEGTTEDPAGLPHPLIVGTGDTLSLDVTGTALITTGIQTRGYHVDEVTAEVIAQAGELYVEGLNRSHAAAAVMSTVDDRVIRTHKTLTHLVAKETLTGDAARANFGAIIQTHRWAPKEGAIIPPRTPRKVAARVDVALRPNDSIQVQQRYTSAGGAGTAVLQLTMLGYRRFR